MEEVKNFVKNTGWTTTGIVIALMIDYLFYLFTGRLLGPEKYGYFGVFLSIYYVLVRAPFSALEMTSKKIAAEGKSPEKYLGKKSFLLGMIGFPAIFLSSSMISNTLGVPETPMKVLGLIFPISYVTAVLFGKIQGVEKFKEYAIYEAGTSVVKFSAVGLIVLGLGVSAAISSVVIEMWAGLFILLYFLNLDWNSKEFGATDLLLRSSIYVLAINAAFSVDILLLKMYESAHTVGLYSSVATLGKAMFFMSVAVSRAAFPKFSQEKGRSSVLKISVLMVAVQGIGAFVFFNLLGAEFIKLTFGTSFAAAAAYAPQYMVFIAGIGGCVLMGNYFISADVPDIGLMLVMPAVEIILILMFHETVFEVIYSGMIAAYLTFFLLFFRAVYHRRSEHSSEMS